MLRFLRGDYWSQFPVRVQIAGIGGLRELIVDGKELYASTITSGYRCADATATMKISTSMTSKDALEYLLNGEPLTPTWAYGSGKWSFTLRKPE